MAEVRVLDELIEQGILSVLEGSQEHQEAGPVVSVVLLGK